MSKLTNSKLAEIFLNAHEGASEILGWRWFHANRDAIHALSNVGIDPSDPLVKAVSSVVLRYVLTQEFLEEKP